MNKTLNAGSSVSTESTPMLMPRRQFLLVGSAAIVGVATTVSLPAQLVRSVRSRSQPLPLLSAGYFDGTVAELASVGSASRRLVSATDLPSGDPSLASSGVRLAVTSFSRASGGSEPLSLGLNVMYQVGDRKIPHMAWSYSNSARGEQRSSGSSFVAPVDESGALELTLFHRSALLPVPVTPSANVVRDYPGAPTSSASLNEAEGQSVATFSLGSERNTLKLRSGIYVLAFRSSASQLPPNWDAIRFTIAADTMDPVLVEGSAPVTFDYLLLSVEPA